jgi:hypothetical protein
MPHNSSFGFEILISKIQIRNNDAPLQDNFIINNMQENVNPLKLYLAIYQTTFSFGIFTIWYNVT